MFALVVLLLWQGVYWRGGDTALASPAASVVRLAALLTTASFRGSIAQTLVALGLSMAISTVGGVVLGLALASNRTAAQVMEPILLALYALPKVTLYPLVLLLFGLGLSAKVAFGAMHALVPVAMITLNAVGQIRPVWVRTARSMRLTQWQLVQGIVLPAIRPDLLAALRLGFSLSLLGVVIGEMFASRRGLGFEIVTAMNTDDTPTLMAVALLLAAVALGGNALLGARGEGN